MSFVQSLAVSSAPAGGLDVLGDLAIILCVAAVTTVLFQRLRQPVVLGYLLAGLIVGPHLPIPLFADEGVAHTLSELGVILLMFSLGLEFSLRRLVQVAPTAGIVAVIQCSLMVWLGYVTARALGWTNYESLFAGAVIAISSTTIIVKAFAEQKIEGRLPEIVFGILIVEDLIAVLLLTVLTAVGSGARLSPGAVATTVGKLAGFLALLLAGGMLIVPRLVRLVARLGRRETTVVASVGICFAFALLARKLGYSVALGAFLGGALVAESGEAKTIERLVEPVRDVFAAIFFVSVGMLIDPQLVLAHAGAVLLLTAVVVVGKLVGVTIGAFVAGYGVRTSVQAGMSLAQIGEFSFIIAGVGVSLGVVGSFLYPIAVAVSALTTLLTPWLIRGAGPLASFVDRRLPHSLQTLVSLYGSWVEGLRSTPRDRSARAGIRRLVRRLFVDLVVIAAIVIGASLGEARVMRWLAGALHVDARVGRAVVMIAAVVLVSPFLLGAVRLARALGRALAAEVMPAGEGGVDRAAAPRRALLVSLQLGILFLAGIPLVAVTQPFLPSLSGLVVLLLVLVALGVPLWRSATNLEGHARAGAEVVLELLSAQSQAAVGSSSHGEAPAPDVTHLLPGLGRPTAVRLGPGAPAIEQTLKQLNLRGLTGATVIAIDRGQGALSANGDEVLAEGDTLVLIGTGEAIAAARTLLVGTVVAP